MPPTVAGTILATKLHAPPARPELLERSPLLAGLRVAATRWLTVLVAPAGWGKTTLLSQWAREPTDERRVLWLSLDRADDEPTRFWRYVLTVLRGPGRTGPGAAALAALSAPALGPVDLALPTLLNELADFVTATSWCWTTTTS